VNRFVFDMAWRETRGSWRHFLFFFWCIAVGVGALVSISLFAAHVNRAVTKEARGLLGGDVEVRGSRPLSSKGLDVLAELSSRGIATTHVSELVAMAAKIHAVPGSVQATQIVELKAVEAAYPFYGTLKVDPDGPLERLLRPDSLVCGAASCFGAVVQESLLLRMGLALGQPIKIGQATFVITGIVRLEPDRMANAFSLGPRVLISQDGLKAAELVKPGSRVRERHLLKLPADMPPEPIRGELQGRLTGESVRISAYKDAQPQLKQFLTQLARYLGLIGLTALFIGGLGVAMSVHAFIREKLKTIAILKTLGADNTTVVRTYVVQALALGVLASLAGALLGMMLQWWLPPLLVEGFASDILRQLGVTGELSSLSIGPIVKGLLLGLLATLLFTMWPLLGIREIKPGAIFRREIESPRSPSPRPASWRATGGLNDRLKLLVGATLLLGLAGLSVWQAGSWKIGGLFIGGLTTAVALLFVSARLLIRWLRRWPRARSFSLRYAMSNIGRPGGQTTGILVAIGVSVTIIVTVSLVEQALLEEVGETRPVDAPSFFFIDIQPDQTDAFIELVKRQTGGTAPELTPLVRSRLQKVKGEAVKVEEEREEQDKQEESRDERRRQWYLSREYVLTFLNRLPKGNTVVAGSWWTEGQTFATPLLSVEEEAAKAMGLEIGSVVEFDIQGTTIAAEVSSIRKVDWGNFSTNFYMILSPGSLDGAPLTYVGTIHVEKAQEVPLQQAVVTALPNVSAIHVGDVLENFGRVLDRLALAIRAVAVFCLVAGAIVMAAALAATRYRRLYESVIFKALGATRGLIAATFATEYMLLGIVSGLLSIALASALSWVVLTHIFELSWSLQPMVLASGLAMTVVLTLLVGLLSTYQILGQRPLAILRHE